MVFFYLFGTSKEVSSIVPTYQKKKRNRIIARRHFYVILANEWLVTRIHTSIALYTGKRERGRARCRENLRQLRLAIVYCIVN